MLDGHAEAPKSRSVTLDLVKGFAIIGVVVLHLALLQSHSGDPVSESTFSIQMFKGIPYSLICTFIIISGYFYVRGRTFAENIKRRVLKLLIYCNLGPYGVFSFYTFSILSVAGGLALTIIISWLRNLRVVRFTIGNVGLCCLTVYMGHMFVAKCLASPFFTFDMTRWLPLTVVQGLILAVITVTVITVATKMYWSWRDKRSE